MRNKWVNVYEIVHKLIAGERKQSERLGEAGITELVTYAGNWGRGISDTWQPLNYWGSVPSWHMSPASIPLHLACCLLL